MIDTAVSKPAANPLIELLITLIIPLLILNEAQRPGGPGRRQ